MLLIKIEGLIFVSTEPFYDISTYMFTYKPFVCNLNV